MYRTVLGATNERGHRLRRYGSHRASTATRSRAASTKRPATGVRPSELAHRLELFEVGVAALRRAVPGHPAAYRCPLCLRLADRTAVESGLLTMEHVPPKCVKGTRMLLTCKPCNDRAGSEWDAHLPLAEALRRFGTERAVPIPSILTIGDIPIRGETTFDGKLLRHIGISKQNDPREIAALNQLGGPQEGDEIRFEASIRDDVLQRARVSWMRSAYLCAFALLGYRYILRPTLDPVRAEIAGSRVRSAPVVNVRDVDQTTRLVLALSAPDWAHGAVAVIQDGTLTILPSGRVDCTAMTRIANSTAGELRDLKIGPTLGWPIHPEYRADR